MLAALQGFEPRVFFGGEDTTRCRAALGHELRLAPPRRLHYGAEAILRILQGPGRRACADTNLALNV